MNKTKEAIQAAQGKLAALAKLYQKGQLSTPEFVMKEADLLLEWQERVFHIAWNEFSEDDPLFSPPLKRDEE